MHRQTDWASADTPISDGPRMMSKGDIGAVPVGKSERLIGMVTDPDVALRVVAVGRNPPKTSAKDVMTKGIVYCRTTGSLDDAIQIMNQKKIRRLRVIDESKRLVDMRSLGNVTHAVSRALLRRAF